MSLIINGAEIPTNVANTLKVGTVNITDVIYNGITYWKQQLYSGPSSGTLITSSKNVTAGVDFPADTPIIICAVGGGGNGGSSNNDGGGGGSGSVTMTKSYSAGTIIAVTIGNGGSKTTTFDTLVAAGGLSATSDSGAAGVNGGGHGGGRGANGTGCTSCFGTYSGGLLNNSTCDAGGGGGAGGRGNGALGCTSAGANTGAGGGGRTGGIGGSGVVRLTWN